MKKQSRSNPKNCDPNYKGAHPPTLLTAAFQASSRVGCLAQEVLGLPSSFAHGLPATFTTKKTLFASCT